MKQRGSGIAAACVIGALGLAGITWAAEPSVTNAVTPAQLLQSKGVEKVVFIKRFTYQATHYYTEYIQGGFVPGGNLCVLDLKDGSVKELLPEMNKGIFERFDLSFDAQKIILPGERRKVWGIEFMR